MVSIIISTYNSSAFINETLDSVYSQSWPDIELIITDDSSDDDTVSQCGDWIRLKRNRFINAIILSSEVNTGISANANRGLCAAKGDWIKFLGADDTLKPDCIESNMKYLDSHPEIRILFSQIDIYRDAFKPENHVRRTPDIPYNPDGLLAGWRTVDSQYRMLLTSDRIHFSPSMFIQRDTLLAVGGFDERFRMLEDYPLWLKLTKAGYKLHFMEKATVNYRQHSEAINNTGKNSIVNPNYFRQEKFRRIYTYPYLPADIRNSQRFKWFLSQIFRLEWYNKNTRANRFINSFLTVYLNPFRYLIWLKKKLNRDLINNEFYM